MRFDFTFAREYEIKVLEAPAPVHPVEKLYHFPVELEEGDRTGVHVRVAPKSGRAWFGFFASGFDSPHVMNAVCSCPDPDSFCVVAGGYAYVVKAGDPAQWFPVEQRPVVELRTVTDRQLLLFEGFTSISALGPNGIEWNSDRLSWEGLRVTAIRDDVLRGFGWDALTDKEAAFELDLRTGKHTGGAAPANATQSSHR